jgi:hypothetical protein
VESSRNKSSAAGEHGPTAKAVVAPVGAGCIELQWHKKNPRPNGVKPWPEYSNTIEETAVSSKPGYLSHFFALRLALHFAPDLSDPSIELPLTRPLYCPSPAVKVICSPFSLPLTGATTLPDFKVPLII